MSELSQARRGETRRGALVLAFGCIYFIWGSTYLAIRFAVETLPPFLMVSGRCLIAGLVLYLWARVRGAPRPTLRHWQAAALTGGLLFVGGQAVLARVERSVDSGLAALVLAIIPVWMILLQIRRKRPSRRTVSGIVLGLGGVALLVIPGLGSASIHPAGAGLLILCALSWAAGSLVWRSALPSGSIQATSLQLLAGGALASVAGMLTGELAQVNAGTWAARPLLAFVYLTIFGTLVTFTAYSWLLERCEPAAVGSYAFVNPVVAVMVGWAVGGETFSPMALVAAAVIVSGVYLVVSSRKPAPVALPPAPVILQPAPESPCCAPGAAST